VKADTRCMKNHLAHGVDIIGVATSRRVRDKWGKFGFDYSPAELRIFESKVE